MRPNAWSEDVFPAWGVVDKYKHNKKRLIYITATAAVVSYAVAVVFEGMDLMNNITMKRRDVFYANLSPTVGSEQDGYRPVLILQNDMGNKHSATVIVAPLTSRAKRDLPTHVEVSNERLGMNSIVLLEQIRTVDKRRLDTYVCSLSKDDMAHVDHAIITSLGIKTMEMLLQ